MYGFSPPAQLQHGQRNSRPIKNRDPSPPQRSALLEKFRADMSHNWELRVSILLLLIASPSNDLLMQDVFGSIVEFSRDQHGSRFIQQRLENALEEEKQRVLDEILPSSALQLTQDVFGNYVNSEVVRLDYYSFSCQVIQKFFERGTRKQKSALFSAMEGHFLPLSMQTYGCRVVQKVCVDDFRTADFQ